MFGLVIKYALHLMEAMTLQTISQERLVAPAINEDAERTDAAHSRDARAFKVYRNGEYEIQILSSSPAGLQAIR